MPEQEAKADSGTWTQPMTFKEAAPEIARRLHAWDAVTGRMRPDGELKERVDKLEKRLDKIEEKRADGSILIPTAEDVLAFGAGE